MVEISSLRTSLIDGALCLYTWELSSETLPTLVSDRRGRKHLQVYNINALARGLHELDSEYL